MEKNEILKKIDYIMFSLEPFCDVEKKTGVDYGHFFASFKIRSKFDVRGVARKIIYAAAKGAYCVQEEAIDNDLIFNLHWQVKKI